MTTCQWCHKPIDYDAVLYNGRDWHRHCFHEALGPRPLRRKAAPQTEAELRHDREMDLYAQRDKEREYERNL